MLLGIPGLQSSGAVNNSGDVIEHSESSVKKAVTFTPIPSEARPINVTVCGLFVIGKI